jgi:hypothetical protein
VPLVKAVQELSHKNDELLQRIEKLESIIDAQSSSATNSQQNISLSTVSLQQNTPNPFRNTTLINYTLPQQYNSAKIVITDKNGKALKEVTLSGSGAGNVTVDASGLAAAAYSYSLYVDGKFISSRQMEHLK